MYLSEMGKGLNAPGAVVGGSAALVPGGEDGGEQERLTGGSAAVEESERKEHGAWAGQEHGRACR